MEKIMVAFDSSTKITAYSVYKGEYLVGHGFIQCKEKQMNDRMSTMSLAILKKLEEISPDIVYIEDTVVVRDASTQRFLTRLQGVVYGYCLKHNCEFNTIRPTSWRKLAGINQSKKERPELKQQAIDMVRDELGIEGNDDTAEAILIGFAALKKEDENLTLKDVINSNHCNAPSAAEPEDISKNCENLTTICEITNRQE